MSTPNLWIIPCLVLKYNIVYPRNWLSGVSCFAVQALVTSHTSPAMQHRLLPFFGPQISLSWRDWLIRNTEVLWLWVTPYSMPTLFNLKPYTTPLPVFCKCQPPTWTGRPMRAGVESSSLDCENPQTDTAHRFLLHPFSFCLLVCLFVDTLFDNVSLCNRALAALHLSNRLASNS